MTGEIMPAIIVDPPARASADGSYIVQKWLS